MRQRTGSYSQHTLKSPIDITVIFGRISVTDTAGVNGHYAALRLRDMLLTGTLTTLLSGWLTPKHLNPNLPE